MQSQAPIAGCPRPLTNVPSDRRVSRHERRPWYVRGYTGDGAGACRTAEVSASVSRLGSTAIK